MSKNWFEEQFPEPLRCWIVHAPRRWPGPGEWWLDLAREELREGGLGGEATGVPLEEVDLAGIAEVTYLPAVGPISNWWRQELRERLAEVRVDSIVQYLPGEEVEAGAGVPVLDLTPALLPPNLALLDSAPAGVHCCWPLIPGLTSDESICRKGLERLAAAGVSAVQPMVPNLGSATRRRLGDMTNRRGYQELFHGAAPDVRRFASWAADCGLGTLLERPVCGRSGRGLSNRRIATRLHLIGELIQRSQGSVDESLSFYRAGRWADRQTLDIEDLVRSGNLGLIPEITDESAREIELLVKGQSSPRFTALELQYRGLPPKAAGA